MTKPEKVFKVGAIRASIFRNEFRNGLQTAEVSKVVLEVRYKDKKTGEWKGTNSLSINDIPKAVLALQQAYEYLTARPKDEADDIVVEKI
jgi:hypothetical protein